jgi:hypothetical protein
MSHEVAFIILHSAFCICPEVALGGFDPRQLNSEDAKTRRPKMAPCLPLHQGRPSPGDFFPSSRLRCSYAVTEAKLRYSATYEISHVAQGAQVCPVPVGCRSGGGMERLPCGSCKSLGLIDLCIELCILRSAVLRSSTAEGGLDALSMPLPPCRRTWV